MNSPWVQSAQERRLPAKPLDRQPDRTPVAIKTVGDLQRSLGLK